MGKQTPAHMKDIFPPGAPSRVFLCLLVAELFTQQQFSFPFAPVAWQFLILQEQITGCW